MKFKLSFANKAQRSAAGKHTTFYLRGRLVDLNDVERYLKRKRSTEADFFASAPTPLDLVCLSVPTSPRSPEKFRPFEMFSTHFRNYVNGALDSRLWIDKGDDEGLYSTNESLAEINHLWTFWISAFQLFDSGYFAEGGQLLRRAAKCMEEVFISEYPRLLIDLLFVLDHFRFSKFQRALDILSEHCANLAVTFFAEGHPLRHIFTALKSDPVLGTEDSITNLLEHICITFRDLLGGQSIDTFRLEFYAIRRRHRLQKVDNTMWQLQQIRFRLEQTCGSGNTRYLRVLFHIAESCYDCTEYSKAEMTMYEVLKILEDESLFSVFIAKLYHVGHCGSCHSAFTKEVT
jgi:hypothetical protein